MPASLKTPVFLSLVALAALAAVGLARQAQKPSAEAREHYAQAQKFLELGEKEKALEELRAAVRLAPDFVEAQRDLIDKQSDKAASLIEQYEGSVKANPDSALRHYLLGKVYSAANKRDKADAEFQKAVDLDPQFGWGLIAASDAAGRKGDTARVTELLDRASKNAGDSAALRAMVANRFLNNRMYDRAIQEADRTLQIDPASYDAYKTKWRARLNITLGADDTRAEVLAEIQALESAHGNQTSALAVARSGYDMLDDEKGADRAKKAILALDPKYFERQDFSYSLGTASGKMVRLSGANARLFNDTFSMKDEKQKLEAFGKLEKDLDDQDAKLIALYPQMLRTYVALKDFDNAERVLGLMEKGNVDAGEMVEPRITVARAYCEAKARPDAALELLRKAIEQLRKPAPKPQGAGEEQKEYLIEHWKNQLAQALDLEGKILLDKGLVDQAAAALDESVKLSEQEETLLDQGRAYSKSGKQEEAVDALSRAYGFEGKLQKEARSELEKIYRPGPGSRPLATLLSEAALRRKEQVRKEAMEKATAELTRTKPADAPGFTLATLAGQKVQLTDLRGKVILLTFWATW